MPNATVHFGRGARQSRGQSAACTKPAANSALSLESGQTNINRSQGNDATKGGRCAPLATSDASDARATAWPRPRRTAARRYASTAAATALALFGAVCMIPAGLVGQTTTAATSTTMTTTTTTTTDTTMANGPQTSTASSLLAVAEQTDANTSGAPEPVDAGLAASTSSANKLKPVNFTLVDEQFAASLNDEELVRRWRNMDGQFQEGIRSILKLIFPQIVAISQDAKVSGDCSGGILKWILSLRNLRSWAIKSKPTSGIFQGSLSMLGNYGQCLSVRAPDEDEIEITDQFEEYFRGQYCVVHLRPHLPTKRPFYYLNSTVDSLLRKQYKYYEKTLYDELAEIAIAFQFIDIRLDLCVPSTCTRADIQRVAELLSKKLEFRAKVLRCDIEARDANATLGALVANDQSLRHWLALPLGLCALSICASLLILAGQIDASRCELGTTARLVCALSLHAALRRLLGGALPSSQLERDQPDGSESKTTSRKQTANERPLCKPWPLYALRNVFTIWFIIVQMTVQLKYQYLRESLLLRNMLLNYWPFQIIINTSMIFESLILITAFTYGYCNIDSSVGQLLLLMLRKYARIVPSMVALIAVTILTPALGVVSPIWCNFVDEQAATCTSTGYLNLFFLQNFISYDKICIPHSWMLCVEMQLVAISIPLLALLRKTFRHLEDTHDIAQNKKDGSCLFSETIVHLLKSKASSLALLSMLTGAGLNFFIVYTNRLPPTWFNTFPDSEHKNFYFGTYLTKAWTHLSTFVLGLVAGHLCRSTVEMMHKRRRTEAPTTPIESTGNSCDDLVGRQVCRDHSLSSTNSTNHIALSTSTSTITNESPSSSRGLVISVPEKQSSKPHHGNKCVGKSHAAWLLPLSALVCLLTIIFSTYSWSTQQLPSIFVSALFDSLSRLVWSLALVGLMIQLCLPKPHTNSLTRFAQWSSCRISIVLGRLSLLAYLWAPYVHTFILAVQEQALFPSLFLIFHVIVGNIVITYAIAFVMSILIEQPARSATDCLLANHP